MKKQKLVVIDCDGNVLDIINYMVKIAKEKPKRYGINPPSITAIRTGYFGVYKFNKNKRGFFSFPKIVADIGRDLRKKLKLNLFEIILLYINSIYYYKKFRRNPKFVPGIINTLKKIKKNGFKLVLVSVGFKRDITLATKKIRDLFDLVICREDVEKFRPAPDLLLTVCKHFNVKSNDLVYIGDMEEDVKMAKKIGATSIFHTRTSKLLEFDIKEVPDYKIDKISEIVDILKKYK